MGKQETGMVSGRVPEIQKFPKFRATKMPFLIRMSKINLQNRSGNDSFVVLAFSPTWICNPCFNMGSAHVVNLRQ